jgi:DNA-directed RNA polymerase subunit F
MTQPQIIEKTPLSLADVKDRLKAIHKRDGELTFRGGKTEDYINEVATLTEKKAKEAIKKIEALDISRLKRELVIKIVDILPQSAEHLKVVLSGFNVTLKKEDLDKIISTLDEFRALN